MKRLLLMAAIAIVLCSGCGSVKKFSKDIKTASDSSVATKRDTANILKKDSAIKASDQSFIFTREHIVNETTGNQLEISGTANLSSLLRAPVKFTTADKGSLVLTYSKKDSTVTATATQPAVNNRITTDRTIASHNNTRQDTKVKTEATQTGSAAVSTSVKNNHEEKTSQKEVKRSPLSSPVAIIIGILAIILLIYAFYKRLRLF